MAGGGWRGGKEEVAGGREKPETPRPKPETKFKCKSLPPPTTQPPTRHPPAAPPEKSAHSRARSIVTAVTEETVLPQVPLGTVIRDVSRPFLKRVPPVAILLYVPFALFRRCHYC